MITANESTMSCEKNSIKERTIMEYRLATNWKNAIYFDENGHVVHEWDGDIVRIEKIKISNHKIQLKAKIKSIFAKNTKKAEVLYNGESYPLHLKIKEDVATIEGEIKTKINKNDELQFRITCFEATQKSHITFLKEKVREKVKEEGNVAVSKDWCVLLERKRLIIMPNGGWKGKLKGTVHGFLLNH